MRRKLLINPKFQISFILWMVSISGIVIAIFYTSNIYFFKYYLEKGKKLNLPVDHVFFTFLKDQYISMNSIFIYTSVIAFFFICIIGLVLSHKVAGPLNKLNEHFKKIAAGKPLTKIQFRSGDYFSELADSYNEHISTLDKGGHIGHPKKTVKD